MADGQDYGASVREWTDVVRRARLGRTIKTVAQALATYADANGTRIRPGVARLAVECEIGKTAVKNAMAFLRDVGLIERTVYGSRRDGRCDEYRLIIGPDILDKVTVLSPAQLRLEVDRLQSGRASSASEPVNLGPSTATPNLDDLEPPRPTPEPTHLEPPSVALEPIILGTPRVAPNGATAGSFGAGIAALDQDLGPDSGPIWGRSERPPPTRDLDTKKRPSQTVVEVLTEAHPPARDRPPEDPQPRPPLPSKCVHGLRARYRPDGTSTCVFCRLGNRIAATLNPPTTALP